MRWAKLTLPYREKISQLVFLFLRGLKAEATKKPLQNQKKKQPPCSFPSHEQSGVLPSSVLVILVP